MDRWRSREARLHYGTLQKLNTSSALIWRSNERYNLVECELFVPKRSKFGIERPRRHRHARFVHDVGRRTIEELKQFTADSRVGDQGFVVERYGHRMKPCIPLALAYRKAVVRFAQAQPPSALRSTCFATEELD